MRQADRIVYDSTGWAIANATVYHGKSDREQVLANARLIAAAPELLEALRHALDLFDHGLTPGNDDMTMFQTAIAKATQD
jgi:hypothetical protein